MTFMETSPTTAIHMIDRRVGRLVAGYIASGGHSQAAAAAAAGIGRSDLSRRINGTRRWNLDELFKIADFLGVPVGYFFDFNGDGARMLEVRASRCTVVPLRQPYATAA